MQLTLTFFFFVDWWHVADFLLGFPLPRADHVLKSAWKLGKRSLNLNIDTMSSSLQGWPPNFDWQLYNDVFLLIQTWIIPNRLGISNFLCLSEKIWWRFQVSSTCNFKFYETVEIVILFQCYVNMIVNIKVS